MVINPTAARPHGGDRRPGPGRGRAPLRRRRRHALPGPGRAHGRRRRLLDRRSPARRCAGCSRCCAGRSSPGGRSTAVERHTATDGSVDVTFHAAAPDDPPIDLEELREELLELGEQGATIRFRQVLAPTREVLRRASTAVPGFGWRTYHAGRRANDPRPGSSPGSACSPTTTSASTVDPDDGTFTVTTEDGVEVSGAQPARRRRRRRRHLQLLAPRPTTCFVDRAGLGARAARSSPDPVRARLLIVAVYQWPSHAVGNERWCVRRGEETALVEVRTTLELHAHERFVRVHVEFDNRCRDHRLPRALPAAGTGRPLGRRVRVRGRRPRPHDRGRPPRAAASRRSCRAASSTAPTARSGSRVLHDGLLEYEVVDDGRELALTLLRATGYLSRTELQLRPNPAGPLDPLEGPQLQGHHVVEYAVLPHRGDWRDGRPPRRRRRVPRAARARARRRTGRSPGARPGGPSGSSARSSRRSTREPGGLVVRVLQPVSTRGRRDRRASSGTPSTGWIVDLLGGAARVRSPARSTLGPWEIATLRLD